MIAFSTPAQNPRGSASSTRSTGTSSGYRRARAEASPTASGAGDQVALGACRRPRVTTAPTVVAVAAAPRRRGRGSARATSCSRSTGAGPATSSSTASWSTKPISSSWFGARAVPTCSDVLVAKEAGEPLGHRGLLRRLRPGPHLRQPLRVLLHLPAPEGHAAEPLAEGRRLPALVPLRQLHDPHPVHRDGPRASADRASLARCSSRSTPPTPTSGLVCSATGGARPACAGCGRSSTAASRCTVRSWSARAATTARCSRTRWPGCSTATPSSRASACVPLGVSRLRRAHGHAPAHPRPRRRRSCDSVAAWQETFLEPHSAGGWSSPPTSTTCWPGGPFPAGSYEGFPQHENGVGMARAFDRRLRRRRGGGLRRAARVLRRRSTAHRPAATGSTRAAGRQRAAGAGMRRSPS